MASGSKGSWLGGASSNSATATGAAGAETCNAQAGLITTEALTTASGATATRTLTNSMIGTDSIVLVSLQGGTNTVLLAVTAWVTAVASGSATIKISNLSGSALNGSVGYAFLVI